jgi:hypothetical protein
MTGILRAALLVLMVMAAGCVGATVESTAPLDQSLSGTWATRAPLPTARQEVAVAAVGN